MSEQKTKKVTTLTADFGGEKLTVETGKLAEQASGAVTMQHGDTKVLATVVVSNEPREGATFFPLSVDFEERWYATGKISGSRFIKREARPSELAILRSRLTDRTLRPLFPKGFQNDVQVIITALSVDEINDPGVLGMNAASAALSISGAPFEGPIGAVRVGYVNGKYITNPTTEQRDESELDLVISGTKDAILMVEAGAEELSEEKMVAALDYGQKAIQASVKMQEELREKVGKEIMKFEPSEANEGIVKAVDDYLKDKLGEKVRHADKFDRQNAIDILKEETLEEMAKKFEEEEELAEVSSVFAKALKDEMRRAILEEDIRPDNRKLNEVRAITCELDLSPRAHGSALFTRGKTQMLSVATLGSPSKAQIIDAMDQDLEKRFMHYYNFAPYAAGEARPLRGTGRREIGHGALAERAIQLVLPAQKDFPYTIRVVSESLSSDGSTSMGSVCGTTLALMAAGVPIKEPVAGIAMGLISKEADVTKGYKVLTDIQAAEDYTGDMDFKVAGTKNGITALQMDIKVKGLTLKVLKEAIDQATEGRNHIMGIMLDTIPEVRKEMSEYAPRLTNIKIDKEKIGAVIGKGGEIINKIIDETGVEIDIQDDGNIVIASTDAESTKSAVDWIKGLTAEPEVGKIYEARVVKVMDFGAFAEFMPGREGLVHISKLADHRVEKVTDEVKEGDTFKVKLMEIDDKGRCNLSKKDAK